MPLTSSIANGIAFGFILYAAIKLLADRIREASPAVIVLACGFSFASSNSSGSHSQRRLELFQKISFAVTRGIRKHPSAISGARENASGPKFREEVSSRDGGGDP